MKEDSQQDKTDLIVMRLFFCIGPAILLSSIAGFFDIKLGIMMFIFGFGVGWLVTGAKHDDY